MRQSMASLTDEVRNTLKFGVKRVWVSTPPSMEDSLTPEDVLERVAMALELICTRIGELEDES